MSDGHFNKCFLPHTQYQSGVRTGKAMQRMKSVEVFRKTLERLRPDLSEEERSVEVKDFQRLIGE